VGQRAPFLARCLESVALYLPRRVAARTERVRLGTFVLLLPLHNPLRVAEDVAVLDNISQGRVDLGVGIGSAPNEFATFGIPARAGSGGRSRRCASSSAASPARNSATRANTIRSPMCT